MEWDAMEARNGMGCNGSTEWNGTQWKHGMEWDAMEARNGMGTVASRFKEQYLELGCD